MTTHNPTARLNLEGLEDRTVPAIDLSAATAPIQPADTTPPWDMAVGFRGNGDVGRIRYYQSASKFYEFNSGHTVSAGGGTAINTGRPAEELHVAVGDVNRDGTVDVIAVCGAYSEELDNTPSDVVRIFDGTTVGSTAPRTIRSFNLPWAEGGAYVAAGDIDGDGYAEVILSRDIRMNVGGSQPPNRVVVYSGKDLTTAKGLTPTASFSGITDPRWWGPTTVAVGDVNGDRCLDVVVAAGKGGGPRVAVWDGTSLQPDKAPRKVCNDFFARSNTDYRGGLSVAVADMNRDGYGEVLAVGLTYQCPLQVVNGRTLATGGTATVQPVVIKSDPATYNEGRLAVKTVSLGGIKYPALIVSHSTTGHIERLKVNGTTNSFTFWDRMEVDSLAFRPDGVWVNTGVWVG
jgi:hypothetical protein